MPAAYCMMHAAQIFILLCVPWLVYSEGAAKSGSAVKDANSGSNPCPTSRDLYAASRNPCGPNGRPQEDGWNSFSHGANPVRGTWSGGNTVNSRQSGRWNTVGGGANPGQAGWTAGNTGISRQPGIWSTVGNGGIAGQGGSFGGNTVNNRQPGTWSAAGNGRNAGQGGLFGGAPGNAGGGTSPGGWSSVLGGTNGSPQTPRQPPVQGNGGRYHQTGRQPTAPGSAAGYPGSGRRPPGQPGIRPQRPTRHPGRFHQPKFCLYRAVAGPCRAFMRRWHYNHVTRQCEKFVYGGCLGNKNNFVSCQQCLKVCTGNPRTHHGRRCGRRWSPYIYIGAGREK